MSGLYDCNVNATMRDYWTGTWTIQKDVGLLQIVDNVITVRMLLTNDVDIYH